jgi:hypothetical protein
MGQDFQFGIFSLFRKVNSCFSFSLLRYGKSALALTWPNTAWVTAVTETSENPAGHEGHPLPGAHGVTP